MAKARMLSSKAGSDPDLNSLSVEAELTFVLTIAHLDRDGLITGDPIPLWAKVVPRRVEFMDKMARYIQEWIERDLVVRYEWKDGAILFFPGFRKHNQNLAYEREPESEFPPPPGFYRDVDEDGQCRGLIPDDQDLAGHLAQQFDKRSTYHRALMEASENQFEKSSGKDRDVIGKSSGSVHDNIPRNNNNKDQQQDQHQGKSKNNNNMRAFARKEAEYVNGFVGVDAFIESLDHKGLRIFIEWLWLHNGIYAADATDAHFFLGVYKQHPFKGIDNLPGYIRSQTAARIYPFLYPRHKQELEDALLEPVP